jgi:hypothetical protein
MNNKLSIILTSRITIISYGGYLKVFKRDKKRKDSAKKGYLFLFIVQKQPDKLRKSANVYVMVLIWGVNRKIFPFLIFTTLHES